MLDLEALQGFHADPRVLANGAITAIGAVRFNLGDLPSDIGEDAFASRVRLSDYPRSGTIDGDTVAWWRKQSPEAQLFGFPEDDDGCDWDTSNATPALGRFNVWLRSDDRIWCHYYDKVLLLGAWSRLFHVTEPTVPWHKVRDYGVVDKFAGMFDVPAEDPGEGYHNPVEDAKRQARRLARFYQNCCVNDKGGLVL